MPKDDVDLNGNKELKCTKLDLATPGVSRENAEIEDDLDNNLIEKESPRPEPSFEDILDNDCHDSITDIEITVDLSSPSTSCKKQPKFDFLKPPNSLVIKNIKPYDTSSPSLKPGEKRRREFLNTKMEEIARKKPKLSKSLIMQEANKCWVLEKAEKIDDKFSKITVALVESAKKKGKLNLKKDTVSNSVQRIKCFKNHVLTAQDPADVKYYEAQLKKSLDALRKLTSLRVKDIKLILDGDNVSENTEQEESSDVIVL